MLRGWKCVLAIAALTLGCYSPTLPLPPPAAPSQSDGVQPGTIHLHGTGVEANAIVVIRNNYPTPPEVLTNEQKVFATLADEQGTWDADPFAAKGDVLTIWQEFGNNVGSASIDYQVK